MVHGRIAHRRGQPCTQIAPPSQASKTEGVNVTNAWKACGNAAATRTATAAHVCIRHTGKLPNTRHNCSSRSGDGMGTEPRFRPQMQSGWHARRHDAAPSPLHTAVHCASAAGGGAPASAPGRESAPPLRPPPLATTHAAKRLRPAEPCVVLWSRAAPPASSRFYFFLPPFLLAAAGFLSAVGSSALPAWSTGTMESSSSSANRFLNLLSCPSSSTSVLLLPW